MRAIVIALLLLWGGIPEICASEDPDFDNLSTEGIDHLSRYVAIDTSNPPGQEFAAVLYLQTVLEREGIPSTLLESSPGRANLYSRIKGSGTRKPLILLHHVDVVPAGDQGWIEPPFGGVVKDGYLWGRGAVDMKGLGVIHLMTFIDLYRNKVPLNRDVIFLATADEEGGSGLGMTWLMENHFELVSDAGMVLTEGGMNLASEAGLKYVGIEVHQKKPLWLRLTVRGSSGHGATPYGESPAERLVKALGQILSYQSPVSVDSSVARFFRRVAPFQPREVRPFFEFPEQLENRPDLVGLLPPYYRALLQDTITLTVLEAGESTNTIPSLAVAELDCRLLPGQSPQYFIDLMTGLVADPAVQVEPLLSFGSAKASGSTILFQAVQQEARRMYPEVEVGLSVLPGFSDAHLFRERGIPAFGLSPFSLAESQGLGVHGPNERIPLEVFRSGMELFHSIVSNLVRVTDEEKKPVPSRR